MHQSSRNRHRLLPRILHSPPESTTTLLTPTLNPYLLTSIHQRQWRPRRWCRLPQFALTLLCPSPPDSGNLTLPLNQAKPDLLDRARALARQLCEAGSRALGPLGRQEGWIRWLWGHSALGAGVGRWPHAYEGPGGAEGGGDAVVAAVWGEGEGGGGGAVGEGAGPGDFVEALALVRLFLGPA